MPPWRLGLIVREKRKKSNWLWTNGGKLCLIGDWRTEQDDPRRVRNARRSLAFSTSCQYKTVPYLQENHPHPHGSEHHPQKTRWSSVSFSFLSSWSVLHSSRYSNDHLSKLPGFTKSNQFCQRLLNHNLILIISYDHYMSLIEVK